jgi:hypothetical protein
MQGGKEEASHNGRAVQTTTSAEDRSTPVRALRLIQAA